jgi:hypothetical protein
MGFKKFLGTVSPAYGIMSGEGEIGKASRKGMLGLAPRLITKAMQEGKTEGEAGGRKKGVLARAAGEADQGQTGRPTPGRGQKRGEMPMSGGGKKNIAIPMSGEGMKAGGKLKKYQDGGFVGNGNYPFGQGQTSTSMGDTSSGGLGNASPLVQVNAGAADAASTQPFGMKKGGTVKAVKSHRGDGIAQRGRTKGRFV